jgi:hypothetical protein
MKGMADTDDVAHKVQEFNDIYQLNPTYKAVYNWAHQYKIVLHTECTGFHRDQRENRATMLSSKEAVLLPNCRDQGNQSVGQSLLHFMKQAMQDESQCWPSYGLLE